MDIYSWLDFSWIYWLKLTLWVSTSVNVFFNNRSGLALTPLRSLVIKRLYKIEVIQWSTSVRPNAWGDVTVNGVGSLNLHLKHEFPQSLLAAIRVLSKMFPLYLDVTFIRPHLNYLKRMFFNDFSFFSFMFFSKVLSKELSTAKNFNASVATRWSLWTPYSLWIFVMTSSWRTMVV